MKRFILCALLALPACQDRRPAAPTPEQKTQLDNAEDMLNATANEEGPGDHSTGPSNSNH